jgi:thymidine phosphorylase
MATDILDVLRTKRDGKQLSDEQIRFFIEGYTDGSIGDEQASALCMAILLRDMVPDELATWTEAMIESGERLDLSSVGRPTVDKHSTGGVGDKVSLILAPLVAACGAAVPQLSGRGLGHTGGTLDQLAAIAGWRATLTHNPIVAHQRTEGAVICAASETLCPADRKLAALRDDTAPVAAIPLIASSIMS